MKPALFVISHIDRRTAAMTVLGIRTNSNALLSKHNKKGYKDFTKFGAFTV
jgi:hypothetical protein